MKKLLIFVACILCAVTVSAQGQKKVKETVTFNDGTEISGYVARQADGSYLIENESGDMFYYTAAEVKRSHVIRANQGYMGMANVLLGSPMGFSIINGYRLSPQIYLGLETGFNATSLPHAIHGISGETIHIPLNAYFQYIFSQKPSSLFIDTSIGINICPVPGAERLNDVYYISNYVGANFAITFGVKKDMLKNPKFAMWYGLQAGLSSIGFHRQYSIYGYEQSVPKSIPPKVSPQICVKVAFSFK